jgi:hypothetical protein
MVGKWATWSPWKRAPKYGELGPADDVTANEWSRLAKQGRVGEDNLAAAMGAQNDAMGMYKNMAEGNGPSVAEAQQQQGLTQAIAAQQAAAAQAGGGNLQGQMRQGGAVGSAMQMEGINSAAQLRAQEQQAAMAGYAGMGNQMAGQGMEQMMGYEQLGQNAKQAQMQSELDHRALQLQAQKQRFERNFGWTQWGVNKGQEIVESIAQMIGASDERSKDNIEPSNMSASYAVGTLEPKKFEYKEGYGPHGQKIGFSAQDIANSPLGSQLVREVPGQKGLLGIDMGNAAMVGLAASAEQEQRLRRLEAMQQQQNAGASIADSSKYLKETNGPPKLEKKKEQGIMAMLGGMMGGEGGGGGGYGG